MSLVWSKVSMGLHVQGLDTQGILALFRSLDIKQKGYLTAGDLKPVLEAQGIHISESWLNSVVLGECMSQIVVFGVG